MNRTFKAIAVAPANIAFIKYWGQKDEELNLPFNDSISMNLDNCLTTTTVEFSEKYKNDEIYFNTQPLDKIVQLPNFVNGKEEERIIKHFDRIRKIAKINLRAKIISQNNFPSSSGIASSASGFAALTLAGIKALGLNLSEKEISSLARLGSGSACRSIPDGFVFWYKGKDHESSCAASLYPADWWKLTDIVAVVSQEKKEISSLDGHQLAKTSPYFQKRLEQLPKRIVKIKKALKIKNLKFLGETIEEEAIDLHIIAMSSKPAVFYWNGATIELMKQIRKWREDGLMGYFTIDAGSNLHIICEQKQEKEINEKLINFPGVIKTIINHPGKGAKTI